MPPLKLRPWQDSALACWEEAGHRGIVSVVTGGGKTVFALACMQRLAPETTVIVVPTVALLDQWWEEACSFFGVDLDEVHVLTSRGRVRRGTINLAVLNTASRLRMEAVSKPVFLVVDECHKAASEKFRTVLELPTCATLGLSATPQRQYDDWLNQVLVPALGPIIYEYSYRDAQRDRVIDRQGWIRCAGLRVYISYALGGWTVGLQRVADGSTRVWFFRMLLGAFVPGRDTTIQPCAAEAAPDDPAMTTSAADPHTTRAA